MFMKVRYTCKCGCVSEYCDKTTSGVISCANCGNQLNSEDSKRVLIALKAVGGLPDNDAFSVEKLEFIVSPLEGGL